MAPNHSSGILVSSKCCYRVQGIGCRKWGNKIALQGAFIQGLSEEIKDELAVRDETDNFESFISLAVR